MYQIFTGHTELSGYHYVQVSRLSVKNWGNGSICPRISWTPLVVLIVWAGTWEFGTDHISKQQWLRQICSPRTANNCFSHTQSMDVDEGLDHEASVYVYMRHLFNYNVFVLKILWLCQPMRFLNKVYVKDDGPGLIACNCFVWNFIYCTSILCMFKLWWLQFRCNGTVWVPILLALSEPFGKLMRVESWLGCM